MHSKIRRYQLRSSKNKFGRAQAPVMYPRLFGNPAKTGAPRDKGGSTPLPPPPPFPPEPNGAETEDKDENADAPYFDNSWEAGLTDSSNRRGND